MLALKRGLLLESPDGCITDGSIRIHRSPALHLLRAPSLFIVPNFGGGYRTSCKGAQPPPIPTVETAVDDELSRLLQRAFSSSNGAGKEVIPYPYNVTQVQPTLSMVQGASP